MSITEFDAHCAHCGRLNELHSHYDDCSPNPGDYSICWRCLGVSKYDEDLKLVLPTEDEMREVEQDPQYRAALHARRESLTPTQTIHMWRRLIPEQTNPEPGEGNDGHRRTDSGS